jgi:hypothetical protein
MLTEQELGLPNARMKINGEALKKALTDGPSAAGGEISLEVDKRIPGYFYSGRNYCRPTRPLLP